MRSAMAAGLVTLAVALMGCTHCKREGCDAVSRSAPAAIDQGVAGAVASETDVVANGCQECPLTTATLPTWRSETAITDPNGAAALRRSGPPTETIVAKGRYEKRLMVGHWLICTGTDVHAHCAAVTISPGRVVTVNVKFIDGPPTFLVFENGVRQEQGIFGPLPE